MTDRAHLESELVELREALADSCDGGQITRLRLAIESRERELAAAVKPAVLHNYMTASLGSKRNEADHETLAI